MKSTEEDIIKRMPVIKTVPNGKMYNEAQLKWAIGEARKNVTPHDDVNDLISNMNALDYRRLQEHFLGTSLNYPILRYNITMAELLKKYVGRVLEKEGVDFIPDTPNEKFCAAEIYALKSMSSEHKDK